MADSFGVKSSFHIDENKVFIVRKKADGYYKIFHDGREEKFDPELEAKEAKEK